MPWLISDCAVIHAILGVEWTLKVTDYVIWSSINIRYLGVSNEPLILVVSNEVISANLGVESSIEAG